MWIEVQFIIGFLAHRLVERTADRQCANLGEITNDVSLDVVAFIGSIVHRNDVLLALVRAGAGASCDRKASRTQESIFIYA
jgi:hypothetical protein